MLEFATIEGARVCGLEDRTGSLTPGKQADVVVLRCDHTNTYPVIDPVSTVVHQADTRNVDTVIVAGAFLKRDGKLVGADLRAARDRAASSLDYLLQHTTIQPHWVQSAGQPDTRIRGNGLTRRRPVGVHVPRPAALPPTRRQTEVKSTPRLSRSRATAVLVLAALLTLALAAGGASGARSSASNPKIAYLSFAVANSYDAPMLAAAKAVAKAQGASVTVFDAANDPKKQLAQLQTAITSKQYDGIIVQPIFGPQLIPTIKQAIKAGLKVVNIDQILGTNPGTAAPPVQGALRQRRLRADRHRQEAGPARRTRPARQLKANPCKVGYLYSVKVSSLDTAIRKGFDQATKGHNIKVVAEGETFYNPANALKAAQTMLQAQPDLNVIVGADQGATGAQQALERQEGDADRLRRRRRRPQGRRLRRLVRHGRAAARDRGQARRCSA